MIWKTIFRQQRRIVEYVSQSMICDFKNGHLWLRQLIDSLSWHLRNCGANSNLFLICSGKIYQPSYVLHVLSTGFHNVRQLQHTRPHILLRNSSQHDWLMIGQMNWLDISKSRDWFFGHYFSDSRFGIKIELILISILVMI